MFVQRDCIRFAAELAKSGRDAKLRAVEATNSGSSGASASTGPAAEENPWV